MALRNEVTSIRQQHHEMDPPLRRDPLADIRVLQGGQHLAMVIKDGRIVSLHGQEDAEDTLLYASLWWT
jgi:hypothetical protein